MFRKLFSLLAIAALSLTTACTRIETGEVGMRVNFDKTINTTELQPGTWNQVVYGDVITFPVKDITVTLENKTPMTSDNTALADFDVSVVYAINPSAVADIYTTKSRSFHTYHNGDIFLMHGYVSTLVNNASYKAIREYKALDVADNRAKIEEQIRSIVTEQLRVEKLDTALHLSVVQVRNVAPNQAILAAATEYVRAQNELKIKETEVQIAKKESERMAALSNNSSASIAFMNAQAELNISEGIKNGKVHTIVVPRTFTSYGNFGK